MKMKRRSGRDVYYFDSERAAETEICGGLLAALIGETMEEKRLRGVVVVCIGTDRSTGDSLGPLIGYKLNAHRVRWLKVVGTLERPVHAMNLEQSMEMVRRRYPDHLIVAVDASIGRQEHVGCVTMGKGALRPGLGVSKELQEVGDVFITGIVGGYCSHDPLMLQSIRLSIVMKLADYICDSIFLVEQFLGCPASV